MRISQKSSLFTNYFLSLFVILTVFATLAQSELSTAEKIKKHEEWLKNRRKQKSLLWASKKSIQHIAASTDLKLLWNSKDAAHKNETSINEVYPIDNEISTTTDTTTTTTITENIANLTTTTTKAPAYQKHKLHSKYPRWGNWSKWSACSRSCGGGLMYQQRKCINRVNGKPAVNRGCVGIYRRYRLCNEEQCKAIDEDFRMEQCSAYNEVDFQGQRYTWEPYMKADAECELNCKPIGMKYFATLNSTVIDGTPCYHPAEYYRANYRGRALCVRGICKAILSTGIVASFSANSGTVGCGGLLCRPVTGIFTRDPLPDEAYIHVATIPAGASNISITELKNSINLLVLRISEHKFIFNGDNIASESGAYEAAGAVFDYHRIDGLKNDDGVTEWVTCTGPVLEDLELMIFSRSMNPGIKYEYLLPVTADSEENDLSIENEGFLKAGPEDSSASFSSSGMRKRRYNWKVVGFSPCSKSCGGGLQQPIIHCVRENPLRYVPQKRCHHTEKPVLNENLLRCNTQPCPAFWRTDDWSECLCQQGSSGRREREVSCVQELATGIIIRVDNAACQESRPPSHKSCECAKKRRMNARYRLTNGTHGHRHREKAGMWLMSDWNQFCSTDCGTGVEYRTIFCERTKQNPERCDQHMTPEITRPCESEQSCKNGEWFTGPWSSCNGNCFNLTRSRPVLCILNQLIVEAATCKPELKPQEIEKCSHEEVEYCGPRWHYSDWTECTKTCDGGTQKRSVKCVEYDAKENMLKDSNLCRYSLREPIYRSCNTQKCEESHVEYLQNDVAVSCMDDLNNCQWVVKAKLCSYDYYRKNCCYSCGRN